MIATDYCKKVFDGTHDSPKPVENGRLLITSKHIANRSLDISSAYLISEEDFENVNKRSQVHQWDILFSMIGTVGNVYIETSEKIDYAIKNMGVFSCQNKEKAYWLYYYLQSPLIQAKIDALMAGAVQKFVPLGFLRDLDIPEYTEKSKKVVQVLSALDDKIALNKKMNQKLEAMAKRLYDYWFVQYDFPDKNGHPYKTTGGPMTYNPTLKREIPAGWEVNVVGDVCETVLGGTPSTENESYWNGNIPWLNSGEVAEFPILNAEKRITEDAVKNSATAYLPAGSVTLSITRHLRPSIMAIDACINQSVAGIKENDILKNGYLYPYLVNEIPRLNTLRGGAQQPHINKDTVDKSPIALPTQNVLHQYYEKVNPLYNEIIEKAKESQKLTTLRDKLLPLLMNGQVVVR